MAISGHQFQINDLNMIPDSSDSENEDIPSDERNRSYTDSDNDRYLAYQDQDSPELRPKRSRFLSDQDVEFKKEAPQISAMSLEEVKNKVMASIQSLLDSNFDISSDIPEWIFDNVMDKEKVADLDEESLRKMLDWFHKNRVNAYTFC